MRRALDVGEARFELRQNFENAFRVVLGVETFGDLLRTLVRTSHVSDWSRREHMELIRRDTILTRARSKTVHSARLTLLSFPVPWAAPSRSAFAAAFDRAWLRRRRS